MATGSRFGGRDVMISCYASPVYAGVGQVYGSIGDADVNW